MKHILSGVKRVHFVGIGGIGMSALAKIMLGKGYAVSGSDIAASGLTRELARLGAAVFTGHCAANLPEGTDLVVYSSCIRPENPEMRAARRKHVPAIQRGYLLGALMNREKGVAVTGTHGKTTTTALLSSIFMRARRDPTVAVGGECGFLGSNARFGKGGWMVAEADESDGSFTCLTPWCAVITNIEPEHLDHYRDLDRLIDGYARFAGNTRKGGALFYCNDDPNVRKVLARYRGRAFSFGMRKGADIYPERIRSRSFTTTYRCVYRGRPLGTVTLRVPGEHNVLNSLAAILVGLETGVPFAALKKAVAAFKGVKRRFQVRWKAGGITVVEDYAHHPTEIRAVIGTARCALRPRRLVVVFQPHRYTRTRDLRREFARCFRGADTLILTDIYAANERPIKGVTIGRLCSDAAKAGQRDARVMAKDEAAGHIVRESLPGDVVLIMGAGDIKDLADSVAARFHMRHEMRRLGVRASFAEPLAPHTTFRIGGPAAVWAEPRGVAELRRLLIACRKHSWKTFVIGNGSNVLVRDGGWDGVMIRLSAPCFRSLAIKGTGVTVGAGYPLGGLIGRTCMRGLGGLESLIGIPGTVGGALFMNAGGAANPIFTTIGALVDAVKVMDCRGRIRLIRRGGLVFGYRTSNLGPYVILEAALRLIRDRRDVLLSRARDFLRLKRAKQGLDAPSAGCVFKNPRDVPFTAGQLIDMMGFRGLRVGGAEVSRKHANFIVNAGGATAQDVFTLIDDIKRKVADAYRVELEREVKVL